MQSLGIDNIIDLKASPISSPSTTILKRPRQEKQQRAVISVVKGRISDIERWTQLYAHVTVNDLLPSLPSTSIFFFFLYSILFLFRLVSFNLFWLRHISTEGTLLDIIKTKHTAQELGLAEMAKRKEHEEERKIEKKKKKEMTLSFSYLF